MTPQTNTGEYFFNQMNEDERTEFYDEYHAQWQYSRPSFEEWLQLEFISFDSFLSKSFDWKKTSQAELSEQAGHAYWFWIMIKYNVSQATGFGG